MKILRDFFERLKQANLSLKPSKCRIGYDKVDFWATLCIGTLSVYELNLLDAFCKQNVTKQRNSAVVCWVWLTFIDVMFLTVPKLLHPFQT